MLERTLERALALTPAQLLLRWDSGFDSEALFAAALNHGRGRVDVLGKWNPRTFDREACAAAKRADADTAWEMAREGKRLTTWVAPGRAIALADGSTVTLRRILRLTERTITADGQALLLPKIDIDGWETTLLRHPAKRRRLKTVMQEMMRVAARLTAHTRQIALHFGRHCPAFQVWRDLYTAWHAPDPLPESAAPSG